MIDELYEPFLEKFTAALTAVKQGDPRERGIELGPFSSGVAADRLEEQVHRAVDQGATVVAGGKRNGQLLRARPCLTDVTPENDIYREELFGPVASVYRVQSEDEAVALANDTPFGLGSYVMTTDPEQAARVADRIDAGMVYVNIVGADSCRAAVRRHETLRLRPRARPLRRRRVRQQETHPHQLTLPQSSRRPRTRPGG